ncbi:hypothetical protein F3Y22_tig00110937pilonHSYRG00069 [Hibiscus syriacus]|uniref:RNase H type-1 domain-containing protein n=1 Tax=Hibiscus syriacus TaxID=106335 RepID=A0A6A2ZD08_HIBSY|nr:uncharacterized protein LOC120147311 [Hibiscus syriacus]KAE8689466.1 hypothetical protein F3Y22_tig00110937pilonHSYRG00069 [Hibiscus syriacus]
MLLPVPWSLSEDGRLYLNTDGAPSRSTNHGSAKVLIQNSNGDCLVAFRMFLGHTTVLEVQLWGILEVLRIVWQNCFERIVVQTDSSEALQLLSLPSIENTFALVRSIATLYNKSWCIDFKKIYREANVATGYIAKMTALPDGSLIIFYSFSAPLLDILRRDTYGPPYSHVRN